MSVKKVSITRFRTEQTFSGYGVVKNLYKYVLKFSKKNGLFIVKDWDKNITVSKRFYINDIRIKSYFARIINKIEDIYINENLYFDAKIGYIFHDQASNKYTVEPIIKNNFIMSEYV